MIFKHAIFILLGLLGLSSAGYAAEQKDTESKSTTSFMGVRPFVIRSDFASSGTLKKLKGYRLNQKPGYSLQGYPQFQRVYATYELNPLSSLDTHLARSPGYARYLNKHFKPYILQHPEKFSAETIADYSKGLTKRNPKTIDGKPLEYHHDGGHRFLLVEQEEHHSLPHVGGNKTWGPEYARASTREGLISLNRETILTARRWAQFSAIELAWSSIALMRSHERNYQTYVVNALASTGSGFLAWSIESLTIKALPLTVGTTPYFVTVLPVNMGGPASWIATGIFILTKSTVMTGWKKYQLMQALEVEKSCQYAEHLVLVSALKKAGHDNSERLLQIINN